MDTPRSSLISIGWGAALGIATSVASAAFNFFHIPPTGRFTIADADNWVALAVFRGGRRVEPRRGRAPSRPGGRAARAGGRAAPRRTSSRSSLIYGKSRPEKNPP
jgi:hypothetical protein